MQSRTAGIAATLVLALAASAVLYGVNHRYRQSHPVAPAQVVEVLPPGAPPAGPESCLVVGDSIAAALVPLFEECKADAKAGLGSKAIIDRVHPAVILIISAGSADPRSNELLGNLRAARAKATGRVIWVQPAHPVAAKAVTDVARAYNDKVVTFLASDDDVHPADYARLAKDIRNVWQRIAEHGDTDWGRVLALMNAQGGLKRIYCNERPDQPGCRLGTD